MREKRGKTIEQRLEDLTKNEVKLNFHGFFFIYSHLVVYL